MSEKYQVWMDEKFFVDGVVDKGSGKIGRNSKMFHHRMFTIVLIIQFCLSYSQILIGWIFGNIEIFGMFLMEQ